MTFDVAKLQKRSVDIVKTAGAITPEKLAHERELTKTKWYHYRFMSPHDATVLFKDVYAHQFALQLKLRGKSKIKEKAGVNEREFLAYGPEYATLFGARQKADIYCISYERYIELAFEFSSNRDSRRKYLPRPNQLGPFPRSAKQWWDFLEEKTEGGLASYYYTFFDPQKYRSLSEEARATFEQEYDDGALLPWYRFENYAGLPAQDEFRDFMKQKLMKPTGGKDDKVKRIVMEHGLLPVSQVRAAMGRARFKDEWPQIRKVLEEIPVSDRRVIKKLNDAQLLLSCFSIPGAFKLDDEYCAKCFLAQKCQELAEENRKEIMTKYGSIDPKAERRRELGRIRAQRKRDRDKGLHTGS